MKTLHEVVINEKVVTVEYKDARLWIVGSNLRAQQKNVIKIKYTNNYNHEGEGFHQFVDPEDKQEYLYTNFEPFHGMWRKKVDISQLIGCFLAHRLFPCFDQPDIKGKYSVTVEAPSEWVSKLQK